MTTSDISIDFTDLETHDATVKQAEYDSTAEERVPFPTNEVIHLAFIARIIESLRFSITDEMLLKEVTLDALRFEIHKHETGGLGGAASRASTGKSDKDDEETISADLKTIDSLLESIWHRFEVCRKMSCVKDIELAKVVTFADFFDYEFPLFPETTESDRLALKLLCSRPAITKMDVMEAVGVTDDSQLIEYLYTTGVEVISCEVFKYLVASLEMHPRSISFAPDFVTTILGAGRRMTSFFPNIVLLIMILIYVPIIANLPQFTLYSRFTNLLIDDWITGCPNGVTDELGCNFLRRHLDLTRLPHTEALRFAKKELIMKLWPTSGKTAAEAEFGSTWLLGGLVIRLAPEASASQSLPNGQYAPCSATNLSTSILHLEVGKSFDCTSIWSIIVPFNYTQEEALSLVEENVWLAGNITQGQSTALIFDFGAYQRSNGYIVHTRLIISLPNGGTAVPHYEISPIDPHAHKVLLPLLITQFISFGLVLSSNVYFKLYGLSAFGFDFWRGFLSVGLITSSYVFLRVSSVFSDGSGKGVEYVGGSFYQVEYAPCSATN